jgi:RNA exonuclease 1
VLAIDCEMAYTSGGFELVRFSAIDFYENVLLDCFVLPSNPILCYNTLYSGVCESSFQNNFMTLKQVQDFINNNCTNETVFIGHGLENDFRQLRILPELIIDTCFLFPHRKGLPFRNSLKRLAKDHVRILIQNGQHSSVEDCIACIKLVKLKLKTLLI